LCLRRLAGQAGDHHYLVLRGLFHGDAQHRFVEAGFTDGELRGVHADGETTAAGVEVVARKAALAALVELAARIECKRMGGDDDAATEQIEHVLTGRLLDGSIGHPHRRKQMRRLIIAAAAAALAAPAAAQQKIDFILNWVPGGDHAPYYYAKKLGWYQKEGIDLSLEPGKGSALATQKVGAGANPVGLADMAGVLVAKGKG